jgi:hypothetical protein
MYIPHGYDRSPTARKLASALLRAIKKQKIYQFYPWGTVRKERGTELHHHLQMAEEWYYDLMQTHLPDEPTTHAKEIFAKNKEKRATSEYSGFRVSKSDDIEEPPAKRSRTKFRY